MRRARLFLLPIVPFAPSFSPWEPVYEEESDWRSERGLRDPQPVITSQSSPPLVNTLTGDGNSLGKTCEYKNILDLQNRVHVSARDSNNWAVGVQYVLYRYARIQKQGKLVLQNKIKFENFY